jgi:uncharacterized protein (TIGR03663 family)
MMHEQQQHIESPLQAAQPEPQAATSCPPRITVEVGLWVLTAVFALVLRLVRLDAAPLSAREAREAMLAWRAVAGQGMPGADYSPVLFAADALVFVLCGASDSLARLWPALLGSVLVLTPCLLRRRIGRVGALAAGLYLAFSPTALFASRQLDGTVVASLGVMALLGGLVCFTDTGRRFWLTFSAAGLALAVTSSPSAYSLLLALGLAWLGLAWAWPDEGARQVWGGLRPHLRHTLMAFSLTVVALSTGLGWNLPGLGAAGDLLAAWAGRFGRVSGPTVLPLAIVVVYEFLALLFGIGGLVWAIWRGHHFSVLLGLWAGLGVLLLLLMPGRTPLDVLGVVLPLAMLAGVSVELLAQGLQARKTWASEWLHALVVLALWIHLYLRLTHYVQYSDPLDLLLAAMTLALQIILAVIFVLASAELSLRGLVVGTGVALLAAAFAAGWGVAYRRPADPQELLVREPTSVEVHDLVHLLRDLSWRKAGTPTTLAFTLETAPDSVLAWYLRDFSGVHRVEKLGEGIEPVVVTSHPDRALPSDAEGYVGQDFVLRRQWNPAMVGCIGGWPPQCSAALEWLILRHTPVSASPTPDRWAILWLQQGTSE